MKGSTALIAELTAQGLCREGLNKREQQSLLNHALLKTGLSIVATKKLQRLQKLSTEIHADIKMEAAPLPIPTYEETMSIQV